MKLYLYVIWEKTVSNGETPNDRGESKFIYDQFMRKKLHKTHQYFKKFTAVG